MIIVRMSGGIGNQLFQYATSLNIARNNNFPLFLDISSYSNLSIRSFCLNEICPTASILPRQYVKTIVEPQNLILKKISSYFNWKRIPKIVDSKKGYNPEIANINFPCYLKGSFISFKYFESFNDLFINSLYFTDEIKKNARNSINNFSHLNLVCVSVRRGDFLNYDSLNVCTKEFYERSISEARKVLDNPYFLFFSDDIAWVRFNFISPDFLYWDENNYNIIVKLYAMSLCNHFIISNSSYSWWGAWINRSNEKKVFCSSKVESDGSFPVDDYYPESWIKIDP
jgi:hypothetical protein